MRKKQDAMTRGKCSGKRIKWLHAAVLTVTVAAAIPSRAADDRAVKLRVPPVYPEVAKRMRISGMVKLEVKVSADGKVTAVKTLSGSPALSSAAEDAVSKWKFVPASEPSTVDVDVKFALAQ
jgi:TonB family protein